MWCCPLRWPIRRGRARLRGHTLAGFRASLRGVEILLVDTDGGVHQLAGTPAGPQPARTGALV
jgi:hypothetical protein